MKARLDKSGVLRDVNDEIASIAADYERRVGPSGLTWGFACECGDAACVEWLQLRLPEYEKLRHAPPGAVVAAGHPRSAGED